MLKGKMCFTCSDFSHDNNGITFCCQCDCHVFYCKHCEFFVAPKVDHLNSTLACSRCENAFNLEPERATQWSIAYGGNSWKMKIIVNGFGRMGRFVARAILRTKDALLAAINDPFVRINDMTTCSIDFKQGRELEPNDHVHEHLKEVHLAGFYGSSSQIKFAIYLLKNAPALKRLVINPKEKCGIVDSYRQLPKRERKKRSWNEGERERVCEQMQEFSKDVLLII